MFLPVYFDWNATAPLDPEVREAMLPWLGGRFGNPSSRHEYGRQTRSAIEEARGKVAHVVGAQPGEVVFTSGGSEANNLFIKGLAENRTAATLAVSAIEHPCIREPARQLQRRGWTVRRIAVDREGRIDGASWRETLDAAPAMLSVMYANNETGVIQDIGALARDASAHGIPLHTDAVQALGRISLDFRRLGVAAMTLSAHKVGGPLGAGALIAQRRLDLKPLIAGGGQERDLRSGTENVAAIVGFGEACEIAVRRMRDESLRLAARRDRIEAELRSLGAQVFSSGTERLANTLFFAMPQIDGETMVARLDRAGFACASGSACSSANPGASQTLLAMGVTETLARCAIRISLGRDTTEEDVMRFIATYPRLVKELKQMTAMAG